MSSTNNRLIIVTGNIAAGKSTFIEELSRTLAAKNIKHVTILEPVEKWLQPYNFLVCTEKNTPLKPISQTYIFSTLMNQLMFYLHFDGLIIIERGVTNAVQEFSCDESNVLVRHLYREMARVEKEIGVRMVVDISTPVEECLNRLNIRNRQGELQDVSVDRTNYLTTLNDRHLEFIHLTEYFAPEKLLRVYETQEGVQMLIDKLSYKL